MSVYLATKSLYQSRKFADMVLVCHGNKMPLHRAIVCTQSALFDENASDAQTPVMVSMPEAPRYVEKFICVLYCGDYADAIFGRHDEAHAMALVSNGDMQKLLAAGFRHGIDSAVSDEQDTKAIKRFYSSRAWAVDEDGTLLLQCINDAVWVYILGDKYDCPIARLIAMYRISLALDILVDVDDLEHDTILQLMGLVNEVYLQTRPDFVLKSAFRRTICSALKSITDNNKRLAKKLIKAADAVVQQRLQFGEDMNRMT